MPWVLSHRTIGAVMYDANDQIVAQWLPKEEGAAICDAMNELVRLREEAEHCHGAKESEKGELEIRAKTIAELRARNAELETFKARVASAFFAWSLPEQLGKGWNHDAVETIYKAIYGDGGAL